MTKIILCSIVVIREVSPAAPFNSESTNIENRSFCSEPNRRADCMDNLKEEKDAPWLSVPQFGDWDQKGPLPDYSLDFSKIREKRKQNKREISRTSIGNEEDFISSNKVKQDTPQPSAPLKQQYNEDPHSPNVQKRRSGLNCFSCCMKA
ncbi:unnamed protein product [Lactuca virosa]|uniref:RIN4 pathogenic type III effector avirulence factor Avr cleavage site domain-containing protein n=1 Tax=Lactuca virosa TaxID=75947 RepID=A0AAU9NYF5_9ASTR|nr:unnamed protein product [Lactuca virosa]